MKTLTKEEKIKIFEEQLSCIKNNDIRNFTEKCIGNIPDYFFTLPASSTGKYHRFDERGDYGLLLHTFRVCHYVKMIQRMEDFQMSDILYDYAMAAAILHDCMKYGNDEKPSTHTIFEHPKLADEFVKSIGKDCNAESIASMIGVAILTHSGQWNTSAYSDVVLPKPFTKMQKILHYADYFASQMPNISLECIEAIYNQL